MPHAAAVDWLRFQKGKVMGDEKKKGGFSLIKLLVYVVLFIALAVAGLYVYGRSIPEEHMASANLEVKRWPLACYDTVADAQNLPKWSSQVKEIRDFKKDGNKITYTQVVKSPFGDSELITTQTNGFRPNEITIEVRESKDAFSGKWTLKFKETADGKGTKVTLTEIGTVSNPFFRAIGSFTMNPEDTLKQYLEDLKKKVESEKPST